jgi:AcrR family transcriptional regulator
MTKSSRPVRIDGEVTRGRIVEAAGELVAAQGYARTESKAIAALAGVDLALINHHFGGREGLYQVLLAEAHRRLIALSDLNRLVASEAPAQDKVRALIEYLVVRTSEPQSWYTRVLARELLSPSARPRTPLEDEVRPKAMAVMRLLSEVTSIPVGDPALVRCAVSIGAPCAMLLILGNDAPGPYRDALGMPRADLIQHLQTFALAGLEAIGRQYAQRGKPTNNKGGRPKRV